MDKKLKILLLGEYSNVHWTLAEGLRELGHEVTVASDGDAWKNYPRDIDLQRLSLGRWDTISYLFRLKRIMPKLRDFDIVQLINPIFLDLRVERILPYYEQLKRQNRSIFLGAFGMDHYWVKAALDCKTFRYSDFNMGSEERHSPSNDALIDEWLYGKKGELNRYIAQDCAGIVSGLYEYEMSYRPYFPDKLRFIPFPVRCMQEKPRETDRKGKIRFFIGIQKGRSEYKGTDIMLRALERLQRDYPDKVLIHKAESVPFETYQHLIEDSDVLLDQLYSYTPAMNGLLAMSKGLVLVGGGEEESYELLGENELRPIVNVLPNEESVYSGLEQLVLHPERIPLLQQQSIDYIRKYHDYRTVAREYVEFWTSRTGL